MQYVSRYLSTILPFVLCVVHYRNLFLNLDSMRWFSHRRRTVARHNCRPRGPLLKKMLHFFDFCPWRPWPLTFDHEIRTRRDFCTVRLTAKLYRPTFSRSEVIVLTNKLTNKQTPLKTPDNYGSTNNCSRVTWSRFVRSASAFCLVLLR